MNEIESLTNAYDQFVSVPWDHTLAGPQKVWFAIYDPTQERRLRLHIPNFEMATKRANHSWKLLDITDSFAHWMSNHEYRDEYFNQPDDMELALQDFADSLGEQLKTFLTSPDVDENTVVAIVGIGSLFGFIIIGLFCVLIVGAITGQQFTDLMGLIISNLHLPGSGKSED